MDDYQSRMVLIQKYNDINQSCISSMEELNRGKIRNSDLSSELLQLEQLVFQQKSETKDESILRQDMLFDFMLHTNDDVNPPKLEMEYFKKLVVLNSAITERITKDYKLDADNNVDLIISEIETLKLSLLELNGFKEANNKTYEDLKNDQIELCKQYEQEVTDYSYIIETNNVALIKCKKKLKHLEADYQSNENELADLAAYLDKLSKDSKSLEIQCKLLQENGGDV